MSSFNSLILLGAFEDFSDVLIFFANSSTSPLCLTLQSVDNDAVGTPLYVNASLQSSDRAVLQPLTESALVIINDNDGKCILKIVIAGRPNYDQAKFTLARHSVQSGLLVQCETAYPSVGVGFMLCYTGRKVKFPWVSLHTF